MKLEPVDSEAVKAIGYDPETGDMAIQFHSGNTSHFRNVSREMHRGLRDAPSIGKHFAKIKKYLKPKH